MRAASTRPGILQAPPATRAFWSPFVPLDLSFTATGSGEPLVILPGLFGSKRNWSSVARQLAEQRRVITVDLRNHGESPWDDVHDYPAMAGDVAQLIVTQGLQPAAVLGHSMGGKVAMVLALTQPELVSRLIVVDIAPARSTANTRAVLQAMQDVPLAAVATRSEAKAAMAEAVPSAGVRDFLALNLTSSPEGLRWGINLESLAHNFENILGFPDVPADMTFDKPTLFLGGGRSPYIQPEHHAEIMRLFPHASIDSIPDAGHWVHADAPQAFLERVTAFLA